MSVKISHNLLSQESLEGLISQFIPRDGNDSGNVRATFEREIENLKSQLMSEKALILYGPKTQSCNIVSKDDPMIKKNHYE